MWPWLLSAAIVLPLAWCGPRYSSRIVDTQFGAVRGIIQELNSRHLEPVEQFLGVPYAATPRRLQPPPAPAPWTGTRLADALPPVCPQRYPDLSDEAVALRFMPRDRFQTLRRLIPLLANQSEDCLRLNIYVPASGNRGVDAPYAVIVYVHGESYEWSSANAYDVSVLASHGHVIALTVNYRLGLLGFLKGHTHRDVGECCPALWDLEAALRWVKQNIAAFGGDPGRVTLVGHDTGAALVNLLLFSESTKGLFQNAALLSGSALSPWALLPSPEWTRDQVSAQLDCTASHHDLNACVSAMPLAKLLGVDFAQPRFLPRFGPWLTNDPLYVLNHAGDVFTKTPLLLGVTTTESYMDMSEDDIQYGFEEDQRNRILRTYIRNAYVYHLNEIFSTVRNEYTDWDKPIVHPINVRDSTLEALSDGHTVSQMLRIASVHSRKGGSTHLFHFNYQPRDTDYHERLGSVRGEDLPYILGLPLVGGHPYFPHNYSRQDMAISDSLVSYLTNFAKTGNPNEPRHHHNSNKEKSHHRGLTWDPYEISTQLYLSMGLKPRMKSHYRGHKMAIWLNLIPQLHQPGDQEVSMRHHHFHERENHYYAGPVRGEASTRIPEPVTATTPAVASVVECEPNTTVQGNDPQPSTEEEEALHHYTSYTAALGVTVGVGVLLVLLNLLLFAGIFYQRDRKRQQKDDKEDPEDVISLDTFSKKSPTIPEPPPPPPCRPLAPPPPPARSCSNLSGTVKKRVQIQEISV